MEWTKEEENMLKSMGLLTYGSWASKDDITFHKEERYRKGQIWYGVGKEGRAPDIDGDWGWCRSWSYYKTLEEAIKNCKKIC